MGQQQAQGDLTLAREVVLGDFPGFQVLVDVLIQIEPPLLDKMEGDHRGEQLGG